MSDNARYVATDQIKQAVAGRETDVLAAAGIDWRAGRPHIQCPYLDHVDNDPSWRWDERRAHAICTCTTNGHADGIFDVVGKVERVGFEEAKIRVAELLRRDDLISIGRKTSNGQKTDAKSLLNPKPANRDNRLPIAYLATRLGIAEDDVPRPSTPFVGLKSLGYFDPPAKKGEEPTLVGEYPCAVFGTGAADGRTHAHRIYLAADGRGKAELGRGPSKKARNPKKSARVIGDDNTAGCAVLWGNPQAAPHLIVFEGIETAAAGAWAFKTQIDTGEVAVVSAITAGGVEALQPYPDTRRVTIGADRDEASSGGNRRGEKAARAFGLKHYEQIEVSVALPGKPGMKADWLDIFGRDGAEAVRNGILGGARFVPTNEERDGAAHDKAHRSELQEVIDTYPLPRHLNSLKLEYRYASGDRIMMHREKENPETKHKEWVPFATPFGVTARLRHVDQADSYGLRCRVQDMAGNPRELDFERSQLATVAGAAIRSALFEAGLRTEASGEQIAVEILKAAHPDHEIIAVSQPGWHYTSGCQHPIFITPNGDILGGDADVNIELAIPARMHPDVARSGTLDNWKAAIENAMSVTDCPHWTLGVASGFVGPIISLTGMDTCGINLSGMSSSGKTLAQQLAASAWSNPDLRRGGLLQSARSTVNATEALAQRANGTLLALDDLANIDPKQAGALIYAIAGGAGKRRMRTDGTVRAPLTWLTFAVLSSECSIEEKIRTVSGEWVAGMAARITDIDVAEVNRNVNLATLKAIRQIHQHYGHAGPAFVRALIDDGVHRDPTDLRDMIQEKAQALAGGASIDSATIRAAIPLALVQLAGQLAQEIGLIPVTARIDEAVSWAWQRFRRSTDAEPLNPGEQAIASLRAWIFERWNVTIKEIGLCAQGDNNREAVAWYDDTAIYIPKHRLREAAGNAVKDTEIGSILHNIQALAQSQKDRFTINWIKGLGAVTAYALKREMFGVKATPKDPGYRDGRDA